MNYFLFKSLHIIFVITWFAGLFYIVRLFIYHVEAQNRPSPEKEILTDQFLLMEKRLWFGITWPSSILAIAFGLSMLPSYWPLSDHPWLMVKLGFVLLLFLYHLHCGKILKDLKLKRFTYTSNGLRIYNEVATLFLFSIVFLAVLKNVIHMGYGLLGFIILSIILFLSIKLYKKIRAS